MILYAAGAVVSMVSGGRLYFRIGKKCLFVLGIVLHSLGIFLLYWVSSSAQLSLLVMAYLFMGMGGGLSANIAQISSLMDFKDKDLLQGSVLWNINRQVAFSVGAVVLISIFSLMPSSDQLSNYQYTFLIASILGLFSLISVSKEK